MRQWLFPLALVAGLSVLVGCKQVQVRRSVTGTGKTTSFKQLPGATPYLSLSKKKPPQRQSKPAPRKVAMVMPHRSPALTPKKQNVPPRKSLLLPPTDQQLRRYTRRAPASRHVRRLRRKIVRWAKRQLGRRWARCGRGFRMRRDCSGWVRCLYSRLQLDLQKHPDVKWGNGVYLMLRHVKTFGTYHKRRRPDPGDLVFWHYTYDKNRNGYLDDYWTHIGIVEKVERDGRISILHFSKKVKRIYMNLTRPRATWERRALRGYRRYRSRCIRAGNRYNRCRRYYSRRRCYRRFRQKRYWCKKARSRIRRVQNSILVRKNKRGRIHGTRTVHLFAGFGTILQSPLPPHLQPVRSLPVSYRSRRVLRVARSH